MKCWKPALNKPKYKSTNHKSKLVYTKLGLESEYKIGSWLQITCILNKTQNDVMKTDKYFTRKATLVQNHRPYHKDRIGPIGIRVVGKGSWRELKVGNSNYKSIAYSGKGAHYKLVIHLHSKMDSTSKFQIEKRIDCSIPQHRNQLSYKCNCC